MKLNRNAEHLTEYQKYIVERFSGILSEAPPAPYDEKSRKQYHINSEFFYILEAPEQYGVEDEMYVYAKNNSNLTISELASYLTEITPDELPPCASEWDDEEDE